MRKFRVLVAFSILLFSVVASTLKSGCVQAATDGISVDGDSESYVSDSYEQLFDGETHCTEISLKSSKSTFGMVISDGKYTGVCELKINDALLLSQQFQSDDWRLLGNGVYYLPFVVSPVTNVGSSTYTLTVEVTPNNDFQAIIWVGQSTEVDGTAHNPVVSEAGKKKETKKIASPKLAAVTSSESGHMYSCKITNWSEKIDGAEYKVCKKNGDVVDTSSYCKDNVLCSFVEDSGVYYFQARFYIYGEDSNKIYSGWSSKKYFISVPILDCYATEKTVSRHSATLKWSKVKGASYYVVYGSNSKNGSYKKIGSTKNTSMRVTKLSGKPIDFSKAKYFKICAVTKVKDKTVKSASNVIYTVSLV